ncbi:MAG: hypothetical protein VX044_02890 [Planctomycetota bacterium]|nr:hypothetical protein [Planctomycetota bacterium]
MLRSPRFLRVAAITVAALAAVAGLALWWTFTPDLTNRLRDDAFYEYLWAVDVAAGGQGEVSAGVSTSGVQWLWTFALTAIAWLFGASAVAVAPFLGGLLHLAAACVWWRLPRDRATGAVLGLCWLGHPLLLREAQNGQETALAALCACGLYALRSSRERAFAPICVLATLARVDLLALVVLLSVARHRRALWRALPAPALSIAAASALNLHYGGGLLQDSAMPMTWLWHENLEAARGFWSSQWWFTRPVLLGGPYATVSMFGFGLLAYLLVRPWWPARARWLPAVAVAAAAALGARDLWAGAICAALLALRPARRRRPMPWALLAVALGLSAIVALHWAVRWYPRDYYLAPLFVAACAALHRCGRWRAALLAFPLLQAADLGRVGPEPLAGQAELRLAGLFLQDALPDGGRVGCFNSGIVAYLDRVGGEGRPPARRGVVNLDGVVDRRSFQALRAGRLAAWLDDQEIAFVVDGPQQFSLDPRVPHACGRFFGGGFDPSRDLAEVARFDVVGVRGDFADSMRLYWRRGRGARPQPWAAPGELRALPSGPGGRRILWGARAGEQLVWSRDDGVTEVMASVQVDTSVALEGVPGPSGGELRIERR